LLIITGAKDSVYFSSVSPASFTAESLGEYAGEYYSDEAQVSYTVAVEQGKLIIRQSPKTSVTAMPTYKDAFDTPVGPLYFERGKRNSVTGFKVSVSRARNVSFKKIK
jgi:hypothetical protein